jgi:hypothetical protein
MQSDAFAFPRRLRETCCPVSSSNLNLNLNLNLRGTCCPASSSNEPLHAALEKPLECSTVGEIPPACNERGN